MLPQGLVSLARIDKSRHEPEARAAPLLREPFLSGDARRSVPAWIRRWRCSVSAVPAPCFVNRIAMRCARVEGGCPCYGRGRASAVNFRERSNDASKTLDQSGTLNMRCRRSSVCKGLSLPRVDVNVAVYARDRMAGCSSWGPVRWCRVDSRARSGSRPFSSTHACCRKARAGPWTCRARRVDGCTR